MEQWVVAYRFNDPCGCNVEEFYRGSEDDCRHIVDRFAGGSSDFNLTMRWRALMGPADDWDNMLADAAKVVGK
jgi:hypothetical protein